MKPTERRIGIVVDIPKILRLMSVHIHKVFLDQSLKAVRSASFTDQMKYLNKAMTIVMRHFLRKFYGWYMSGQPFDREHWFTCHGDMMKKVAWQASALTAEPNHNNPEKHDGWLNSVLPNWVRIYVPQGSELITFEGVENQEEPYIESGKTVYAGFFELRPQGVAKVTVKYRLPFKVDEEYKLLVQKQPGTDTPLHVVKVNKIEQEEYLLGDKEFKFNI